MKFRLNIWLIVVLVALMALPDMAYAAPQKMSSSSSFNARKKKKLIFKSWQYSNDYGIADSVQPDTLYLNLHNRTVVNDYSIANSYNANAVSPIESKIYFDRLDKIDFLFAHAYEPYILTPQDVQWHTLSIAYSDVGYKKTVKTYHDESDITFSFTGNVNQKVNLGTQLHYIKAIGRYANQEGKMFNGSIYGSYTSDEYGLHAAITFNTLDNFENGGLSRPEDLGGMLKEEDQPVRMQGMSEYKYFAGYLTHHYSICTEREVHKTIRDRRTKEERDTTWTEYVPVTTFAHTFECNSSAKRYVEHSARQNFFENTYINQKATNDTASVINIRNTLAATFEEEFNKLHFGATVYAVNEFQRYVSACNRYFPLFEQPFGNDYAAMMAKPIAGLTDTITNHRWVNNTWVGGALYKNQGKWVRFGFDGDICLAGYKLGEFKVNGHVNGEFPLGKDTLTMQAKAYIKNETPDYFLQHYFSNHYMWNNDFKKVYRFYVGGEVAYPTKWLKPAVNVGFENLTNYIYFDSIGLPTQLDGNVQVLAINAKLDFTSPWINLENNVIYQAASKEIPLPDLTLYHNLYYHGCWFKALDTQIGVDMRYHTAYYAPLLNPATGQFMVQHETKIGNYPILNVYGNFYVRSLRLKLFVEYAHFNQYFMKQKIYFSMPGYAYNPPSFRFGAKWHFWQ